MSPRELKNSFIAVLYVEYLNSIVYCLLIFNKNLNPLQLPPGLGRLRLWLCDIVALALKVVALTARRGLALALGIVALALTLALRIVALALIFQSHVENLESLY